MTLPLMNGLRSRSTTAEHPACSFGFFPTAMEDAAVNRLAKSITQLTLCQVTTDEVDAATKLLDKACQKLRGIPDVPSQRITDLEAAIRQMRQLSCILNSCTISASYEVSQAQKAILLMPRTAKGASTSSEELNAQISPRTDDEHNLPAHEDRFGHRAHQQAPLELSSGNYPRV